MIPSKVRDRIRQHCVFLTLQYEKCLNLQELQQVLEKLVKFIGKNVTNLVERDDEKYCFRLHRNRVYYVREELVKRATNVRFPC
jgi:hypothetical protein